MIEPFFFEEMHGSSFQVVSVMGARYSQVLQNSIISSLANKHLLKCSTIMKDGVPPNIATRVKDVLRTSFGEDSVLNCYFRPT